MNKFPFASEVKMIKDNFKKMVDEMDDDDFMDMLTFLINSADVLQDMEYFDIDSDDEFDDFDIFEKERKNTHHHYNKNLRLLDKDDDDMPF